MTALNKALDKYYKRRTLNRMAKTLDQYGAKYTDQKISKAERDKYNADHNKYIRRHNRAGKITDYSMKSAAGLMGVSLVPGVHQMGTVIGSLGTASAGMGALGAELHYDNKLKNHNRKALRKYLKSGGILKGLSKSDMDKAREYFRHHKY